MGIRYMKFFCATNALTMRMVLATAVTKLATNMESEKDNGSGIYSLNKTDLPAMRSASCTGTSTSTYNSS